LGPELRLGGPEPATSHLPPRPSQMHLYVIIWVFALFFPMFADRLGAAGMGIINGGLISMILLVMLIHGFRIPVFRGEALAALLICVALVYYFLAVLGTIAFQSTPVVMGDIYELQRPVLHVLCFFLPLVLIRTRQDLAVVERLLIFTFFALLIIAGAQILRLIDPVAVLYTKPFNIQSGRATVPFVNPYDLAFVTTLPAFFFLVRTVVYGRWRDAALFGAGLLLIALTQSRAVFAGFVVGLIVLFPAVLIAGSVGPLARFRIPARVLRAGAIAVAVISLGAAAVVYIREAFSYLVSGYERVWMGHALNSLNIRLAQLDQTLQLASADWSVALFGNGPGKSMVRNLESTYVFYTFRYGVMGLLLIKLLPIAVVLRELLVTPKVLLTRGRFGPFLLALAMWYLTAPLLSIGNNFAEQVRVSFLFWGLMGVAVRARTLVEGAGEPGL